MTPFNKSSRKLARVALASFAVALSAAAQTVQSSKPEAAATKTAAPAAHVPVAPPAAAITPAKGPITLPPNLVGVVTPDEFQKYMDAQVRLRADPVIKGLEDKIKVHMESMQKIQTELNAARAKALAADPQAKAAADKITEATRSRAFPAGAKKS